MPSSDGLCIEYSNEPWRFSDRVRRMDNASSIQPAITASFLIWQGANGLILSPRRSVPVPCRPAGATFPTRSSWLR